MRKVWKTPSHRNSRKSRSVHPASEFTFQNLTLTSTCRPCWRVFSAQENGSHHDLVNLAASLAAGTKEPLPGRTADSVEDQRKQPLSDRIAIQKLGEGPTSRIRDATFPHGPTFFRPSLYPNRLLHHALRQSI